MHPRTRRQKEVLDYITRFVDRFGHEPSYQQIARQLGVTSRGGIQRHISALETQGLLTRRRDNGTFGLELKLQKIITDTVCGVERVELEESGTAYAEKGRSVLTIPRYLIGEIAPELIFAVQVPDDSLIDRQICPNDVVLFEARNYARRSDVVLARTEAGLLIGLYYQLGPQTEIRFANADREPLTFSADEITVQGVMRGLMRFAAFEQE